MTCQVALVGKSGRQSDLGQRQLGARQHLLRAFDAPLDEEMMRRDP